MKPLFGSKPIEYPEFDQDDPVISDVLKRPPQEGVKEMYRFGAAKAIRDEPYWLVGERFQTKYFPHEFLKCECPYCGPTFILNMSVESAISFVVTRLRMACGCEWRHAGLISCEGPHGWERVGDMEAIPYKKGRKVFVRDSEMKAEPQKPRVTVRPGAAVAKKPVPISGRKTPFRG